MLDPNSRSLYTSALIPPPGMVFDDAIATTFSMDPTILLEAPVYLALMATGQQTDPDPLTILEAIRRHSNKISVYVQKGRIQVPQITRTNSLFGLLEKMILEVEAPKGGVFHPKVWAIRFISNDGKISLIRLVVLTRNMTYDQSWDLSLQLDGLITRKQIKSNKPLAYFFKSLPKLTTHKVEQNRIDQANSFAKDILKAEWELPEGFDEISFYLPHEKKFKWEPKKSNKMAIISPFCSDESLKFLIENTNHAAALISRPETLSELKNETLNLFSQCLHLDDVAELEYNDEIDTSDQLYTTGLHAKAYLFETRYYSDFTHIVIGSANATNAALTLSKNIEILVGLVGKSNTIGSIDEILGNDELGGYLTPFVSSDEVMEDKEEQKARVYLENARLKLAESELSLTCQKYNEENLWTLILNGQFPKLEGITSTDIWPITVTQERAVNPATENSIDIELGQFSASLITGLIAFKLSTSHSDVSARFVLNLPITGIPDERYSSIMKSVINNQQGFIRYLFLLLGDEALNESTGTINGSGFSKWLYKINEGEEIPLLEELIRTYSQNPERLEEISKLIFEITTNSNDSDIVPEKFLKLWSVFEAAMTENDK